MDIEAVKAWLDGDAVEAFTNQGKTIFEAIAHIEALVAEVERLREELDGTASMLLSVQQECIRERQEVVRLEKFIQEQDWAEELREARRIVPYG